jgi:diacylglycerol O-acyltransferase/trehalose O-mycolyltransferase
MASGRRCRRRPTLLLVLSSIVLVTAVVASPGLAAGRGSTRLVQAGDGARVVAQQQVGARLVDLTVQSPALGRTATVRLLTPDGWWERRPGQRWPVLYLLHGCCDTYDSWTRETDVEELRALRGMLVVMPEAGAVGWYSDWWNHGEGGRRRGRPSTWASCAGCWNTASAPAIAGWWRDCRWAGLER